MNTSPELQHVIAKIGRLQFDRADSLPLIDQIAGYVRRGRLPLDAVLEAYEKYLAHHPDSAIAVFNFAYNLARDGQFDEAIGQYERSLELGIDASEEVHLNIANIYMDHLQAHEKARLHLEKALALNPDYAAAHYNLGNLAEQAGCRTEASRHFEKSLQLNPRNTSALARLADTKSFSSPDDPLLPRLAAAAQTSRNSDLHFAIGRAYEQLQEFDLAWKHFSRGNLLDERIMPAYDPKAMEDYFARVKTVCDRKWLQRVVGQSSAHVFVCGMFRSGSTLLEQILGSHPAFVPGGESQFFPRLVGREFPAYPGGLEDVSNDSLGAWREAYAQQMKRLHGDVGRITDKRPDNLLYLGLIKAVLPSAKVLITERDWRDIATSVYSVRLGPGQSYATRLHNIRHYIHQQAQLTDHWISLMGQDLKVVRYEDLVAKPEQKVTEILEWLGEQWDDRCLSFHESTNSVQTASVWQVREPLYTSSVGRWQRYRPYFVEELGPDVDA